MRARHRQPPGLADAVTSLAGPAGVVLLVVAAVVAVVVGGLGALGGPAGGSGDRGARSAAVAGPRGEPTTVPAPSPGPSLVPPGARPVIVADAGPLADPGAFAPPPPVVGDLADGAVVELRARGFPADADGTVRQCAPARTPGEAEGAGSPQQCANAFPVRFDGGGEARVQYQVFAAVGGAPCDAVRRCVLTVESAAGRVAHVVTVFGAPAPPPVEVRVEPSSGLADGVAVHVEVAGLAPGTRATVTLCVPPGDPGQDCGGAAESRPLRIGPNGRGALDYTVRAGPVGRSGRECGPGSPCAVVVLAPAVVAPPVRLAFAPPPGVDYDAARLALGLGLAVALLGVAVHLLRRTDWSVPGEGDGHEIDEAVFADLDAIVAALPPDDAADLVAT